ncbi:hypothetical protein INT45_009243 [Circinella minor]|uniref:Uncharacterized protein n=1 Tax=Circinella minor TaxID=1195481 RepID=A0A8H7SH77_9FUNG|nr:hypothetical protein INT45_009243 [Circinella minor]
MAVRLAYETNRTVVAPPLRLVYDNDTRIQFPWSQLFDFKPIEEAFGIRVVDRPLPLPRSYDRLEEDRVQKNEIWPAEYYERVDITQNERLQQQKPVNDWSSSSFMQWVQNITKSVVPPPVVPRTRSIFILEELKELENPYVHCHALSSWMFRKSLDAIDQQVQLNLALTTNMLTRPDKVVPMTNAAKAIVRELGGVGKFSGLTVHMDQMVPQGQADKWLFGDDNSDDDNEQGVGEEDKKYNVTAASLLMKQRRKDAMKDAALELFSSMPINQAVSAALPIQPSPLRDYLEEQKTHDQQQEKEESEQHTSTPLDRRRLLNVCKDYRRHIDSKFPVIYLMFNEKSNKSTTIVDGNDVDKQQQQQQQQIEQEEDHDDISVLKPILEYFPCVFYKKDMYQWGIIDGSWAIESQLHFAKHVQIQKNDIDSDGQVISTQVVDYEQLLAPLLDLLIAGQGYSFFEVPPSTMTREVLWQLAGNKN